MKQLLSARSAAKILQVSHVTVLDWMRAGKLRACARTARGYLFDAAEVERYRQERAKTEAARTEIAVPVVAEVA